MGHEIASPEHSRGHHKYQKYIDTFFRLEELKGGGQRRKVAEVRGKIAYYLSREMGIPKLPVRFALAGQYMVHHPDVGGQKWNIQLTVTPVIPKLIKGTLFGE